MFSGDDTILQRLGLMLAFGLWIWFGGGCHADGSTAAPNDAPEADRNRSGAATLAGGCQLPKSNTTVYIDGVAVDLLMPNHRYAGDILVLPPWNGSRHDWCLHARFCAKALKHGYRLVLPEMGKSIYAHAVYPETREDWRKEPTIQWVKETLIPSLQKDYCLLQEDGQNFVLGASAGARGAVLLAEELPTLWAGVAALSGDYNPSKMPNDNVYRGFLGDMELYADRWQTAENVVVGSADIVAPLYLGHGRLDQIVSATQTQELYDVLHSHKPPTHLELHLDPTGRNDFAYWGSEIALVLDFFERTQASASEGANP